MKHQPSPLLAFLDGRLSGRNRRSSSYVHTEKAYTVVVVGISQFTAATLEQAMAVMIVMVALLNNIVKRALCYAHHKDHGTDNGDQYGLSHICTAS